MPSVMICSSRVTRTRLPSRGTCCAAQGGNSCISAIAVLHRDDLAHQIALMAADPRCLLAVHVGHMLGPLPVLVQEVRGHPLGPVTGLVDLYDHIPDVVSHR